jgi:hypothetical protein
VTTLTLPVIFPNLPSLPPITVPSALSSEATALQTAVNNLTSGITSTFSTEVAAVQTAVNSLASKLSSLPVVGTEITALETAVQGVLSKVGTLPNVTQVTNSVTVISNASAAILAAIKVIQAIDPAV